MVTRRDVLKLSCAALVPSGQPHHPSEHIMLTRPIPSTNEPLPVVGLGTWQTFDVGPDRAGARPAQGGSARPVRGRRPGDRLLAHVRPRRGRGRHAAVGDEGARQGVPRHQGVDLRRGGRREQMQASLAKLQAPTIDLMQIHNLVDWRTHLRTLRAWKAQKKFRYIGITHYTDSALDELAAVIRAERIDFVQFAYSIAVRAAETRLLPLVRRARRGASSSIALRQRRLFGQVRGKAAAGVGSRVRLCQLGQFFLKFILGHRRHVRPGRPIHARNPRPPPDASRAGAWQADIRLRRAVPETAPASDPARMPGPVAGPHGRPRIARDGAPREPGGEYGDARPRTASRLAKTVCGQAKPTTGRTYRVDAIAAPSAGPTSTARMRASRSLPGFHR